MTYAIMQVQSYDQCLKFNRLPCSIKPRMQDFGGRNDHACQRPGISDVQRDTTGPCTIGPCSPGCVPRCLASCTCWHVFAEHQRCSAKPKPPAHVKLVQCQELLCVRIHTHATQPSAVAYHTAHLCTHQCLTAALGGTVLPA